MTELEAAHIANGWVGRPFSDEGSQISMDSFNCWSLVWHYHRICGLILPWDPFEAEKEFVAMENDIQWRDVLVYTPVLAKVPHCGVAENRWRVIHCNNVVNSVERDDTIFVPWKTARVLRHKSLV